MDQDCPQTVSPAKPFWRLRWSVLLSAIGALGLYAVLNGHWVHVVGAFPYLLLLACPVMHLFMHRGHGVRSSDHAHGQDDAAGPTPSTRGR